MQRLTLPATLDSLDAVTRFVEEIGATAGLRDEQRYRLRLAVEEIATNIVTHGYGESERPVPADASFCVEGAADPDRVWVRLIDGAPEFDPTRTADPADLDRPLEQRQIGGLGIYLVRTSLDEFTYRREDGHNLTTLALKRVP